MKNKLTLLIAGIPAFLLILSIIAFILNTRIAEGKPVISELYPNVVNIGDTMEIKGRNFGKSRESSKILISSYDLLSKYIVSWSETLIKIQIPEKTSSGLIYIETDRGMSEPVVIVLQENVPFIGTGAYLPGLPFIESIDPYSSGTGARITIKGHNFGYSRNNSKLLFSTEISRERDSLNGDTILENFVEVSDGEIINWENKEIVFYLPEFIASGDVYILTESGYSNAAYFEQVLDESNILFREKKTYMLNQTVRLKTITDENTSVNVWFASPVKSLFQRNITTLTNSQWLSSRPCSNVSLYKIQMVEEETSNNISQNTIVDVFEQNYSVSQLELNDSYDTKSPIYNNYTISTELIPSSRARVKNVAASITRRKGSPFNKAKAIYEYVLARLTYADSVEVHSPDLVIDSQIGDAEAYSLLFSALARSSGIPARPVTGLLVDSEKNMKYHWWVEFFIQDFGWFPLDPALADGMPWKSDIENHVEYYWGNIDNQHITFSRGEKHIPRLFPDGIVYSNNNYELLSQSAETNSEIIDLRSIKSDVRINAIY